MESNGCPANITAWGWGMMDPHDRSTCGRTFTSPWAFLNAETAWVMIVLVPVIVRDQIRLDGYGRTPSGYPGPAGGWCR